MPRNLTGKQAKFALGVAMGKSLADSYRESYSPANPKATSVYSNARRARKHAGIARRIAELQVKLMPGPEDMKALYQHALAVATQLTVLGEDDKVRLRAAQWIAGEAEKSGKLADEARKLREEDLEKLREILAGADRNYVAPAAEYESPAKNAAAVMAEVRQAAPVQQDDSKPPAPTIRYVEKCLSRPGEFPARFVKVPVRDSKGPEEEA
jgi:hypothetical protein